MDSSSRLSFGSCHLCGILEKNSTRSVQRRRRSLVRTLPHPAFVLSTDRLNRHRRLLRDSTLYRKAASYRPTRLHKTVDLPADKTYIFGVYPHSTIPTFVSIGMMTEGCEWNKVFPNVPRRGLAASSNFWIPIWREVYLWLGYIDASRRSALNAIKKGYSILILIGGEQEMIKAKPGENILCLRNRKGFVRLAFET